MPPNGLMSRTRVFQFLVMHLQRNRQPLFSRCKIMNNPMPEIFIEISEDEFDNRYQLLENHINPNASWAYGDRPGCLFESFGDELNFVNQQDPQTIWTLIDGDDGDMYLISGLHFINRVGYLLSTSPVPINTTVQVRLPMSVDD